MDRRDVDAEALRTLLARPWAAAGPLGPEPPEERLARLVPSGGASPDERVRLEDAVALAEARDEAAAAAGDPAGLRTLAGCARLREALGLAPAVERLMRIGPALATRRGDAALRRDVLALLRSASRIDARLAGAARLEAFWTPFLRDPARDARTMACTALLGVAASSGAQGRKAAAADPGRGAVAVVDGLPGAAGPEGGTRRRAAGPETPRRLPFQFGTDLAGRSSAAMAVLDRDRIAAP